MLVRSTCFRKKLLLISSLNTCLLQGLISSFILCVADDRYPAEAVRAELSSQLNLSDKQLQMWFCHRRLKDRKGKDEDSPSTNANINVNVNANANVSRKKPRTEKQNPSQYGVALTSGPGDAAMLSGEQYAEEYSYENAERFTPEVRSCSISFNIPKLKDSLTHMSFNTGEALLAFSYFCYLFGFLWAYVSISLIEMF